MHIQYTQTHTHTHAYQTRTHIQTQKHIHTRTRRHRHIPHTHRHTDTHMRTNTHAHTQTPTPAQTYTYVHCGFWRYPTSRTAFVLSISIFDMSNRSIPLCQASHRYFRPQTRPCITFPTVSTSPAPHTHPTPVHMVLWNCPSALRKTEFISGYAR